MGPKSRTTPFDAIVIADNLGNRLLVDPVTLGQSPQARLTMLYRSTDCPCRCGAAVENLAHSAPFNANKKIAPLNSGTKQPST